MLIGVTRDLVFRCTAPDYMETPWAQRPPGVTNCNSLVNVSLDALLNRTACQKQVQRTRLVDCFDNCSFPCREVRHLCPGPLSYGTSSFQGHYSTLNSH